jgi:hypothetical protein
VKLNARLNSGSGSGDMVLLIPNSVFAGADPTSFVYLYSKMGGVAGATANGGFEEWAVKEVPVTPPTPPEEIRAGASIGGRVFLDADRDGVFDVGTDRGLAGVFIHLRGENVLGESVDLVVQTDENGFYKFTGLRAGTYSIWEEQPFGFEDGEDYLGMVGGQQVGLLDNDRFSEIQLQEGDEGVDYIFTEYFGE